MQTVFDDTLTKNTSLMVRMNELQTVQGFSLTNVSREVKVDCVEHFVVGYATRNHIVLHILLTNTAQSHKIEPLFIICFKFFHLVIAQIIVKNIMVQISLIIVKKKAQRVFTRLFFKQGKIESFAKIEQIARVKHIGRIDNTIRYVIKFHANTPRFFNIAIKSSMIYSLPNV